jgi:alpha-N-arabinofuranosidase
VTAASLAQLVNVIAPIMTEPGGPAWRQTIFFPFAITSRLARGEALRIRVESDSYPTKRFGDAPLVDAIATHDASSGQSAIFLVNRSLTESATVTVDVRALGEVTITESHLLADDDINAANTLADTTRVGTKPNASAKLENGTLTVSLPPVSWTALALA